MNVHNTRLFQIFESRRKQILQKVGLNTDFNSRAYLFKIYELITMNAIRNI